MTDFRKWDNKERRLEQRRTGQRRVIDQRRAEDLRRMDDKKRLYKAADAGWERRDSERRLVVRRTPESTLEIEGSDE